ncbi:MAG TPA: SigB/SigF/SigG family RNA polymerase sigma factor [Bacillota bacterium]|nr:SigB/SigF/SigG family RNA polymerase sigma factor [Bacillota bacterium]
MSLTASDIQLPKLPLLSETDTRQLILEAQNGVSTAKDRLVQHNLRLVMSIANRFSGRGEAEDLFQIGCIGLVKAIERFNLDLGVQFSTYAVPLIMGEIKQYLRDSGPVKVSRSIRENAQRIFSVREEFLQSHGREPTVTELESLTSFSHEEIATALEANQPIRYIQETLGEEGHDALTLEDQLPHANPDEEGWLERMALEEVMQNLEPRLKLLLELRFFDGQSQTQVSEVFGVSQVHISRLEREALRQLRLRLNE